jgi:hypothetical protein
VTPPAPQPVASLIMTLNSRLAGLSNRKEKRRMEEALADAGMVTFWIRAPERG